MFRKILVANRGEIATRVIRTCREAGIRTVAVYSEPDRTAPFVARADESIPLGGKTPAESYLRADLILRACRETGADAVHPGYGFLSENADFAEACRSAGIAWIGPSPEALRAVGNKLSARRLARSLGIPVLPGEDMPVDIQEARRFGERNGYPILLKAAGGGGGRGMRVVRQPSDLERAYREAAEEARSYFRDPAVFVERFLERPRHVEVQVVGDRRGNLLHLFERECSVQRRHQKLVEESPSPAVDEGLRARLAASALRLLNAVRYDNAGTVEFLLDEDKNFYFMEVNARLQVEHPVTEMICGVDLVRWQILAAEGEALPLTQDALRARGHAIECRIVAEDPAAGFTPSLGEIGAWRPPAGPFVRVDSDASAGSRVTPYYDSLLAKLIVWGEDRPAALRRMHRALGEFLIAGVKTPIGFYRRLIQTEEFASGRLDTRICERIPARSCPEDIAATAAALACAIEFAGGESRGAIGLERRPIPPWKAAFRGDGSP